MAGITFITTGTPKEIPLLAIVQEFCRRRGLPIPVAAAAASDDTTQQMVGLLNEGIQEMVDRYFYQQITQGCIWTAKEIPGLESRWVLDLSEELPDFKAMVPHTFWNWTDRTRVEGPLTPQEWQQMNLIGAFPAKNCFRLVLNRVYIVPPPGADTQFAFEYISRYGVYNPITAKPEESYNADTSFPKIPSYIVLADLKWRWERDRGFPYAEDQRTCEEMITNMVGREPGKELDMGAPYGEWGPGIIVPAGSWSP